MKHIGLFEGIGGFSLAARWMGWETKAWCEWNEFGQKVLRHHFPKAIGHGDITKTDFTPYANTIDILTGGFPCQPYSQAGKRLGKEDDRHLWPEMLRAIKEVQPGWIVGENVSGLLNWNGGLVLNEIKTDLESAGFEVIPPCVLPACSVNAPHRRDRVWIIAYSDSNANRNNRKQNRETDSIPGINREAIHTGKFTGTDARFIADTESKRNPGNRGYKNSEGQNSEEIGKRFFNQSNSSSKVWNATDTSNKGLQRGKINGGIEGIGQNGNEQLTGCVSSAWENFPTEPPLCGGNDGIPDRVDRIKALGNAIVPQVAYQIFKAIEQYEQHQIKCSTPTC